MKHMHTKSTLTAVLATFAMIPSTAFAEAQSSDTIRPAFRAEIPNIPGKTISAVVVDYPPGGKTSSHHHAPSAFVTGYVLSGSIRSQVDDGKVQVFHVGEHWHEQPGAHHPISENASATEPARLLAIFVADSSETELTTIDKK